MRNSIFFKTLLSKIIFAKKGTVVFENADNFSDNSWTMFKFFEMNRKNAKLYWICSPKGYNKAISKNISKKRLFVFGKSTFANTLSFVRLCRMEYHFYSQNNPLHNFPNNNRKVVFLGHGSPVKNIDDYLKRVIDPNTYVLSTSPVFDPIFIRNGASPGRLVRSENPRNDELQPKNLKFSLQYLGIPESSTLIVCMATFRNTKLSSNFSFFDNFPIKFSCTELEIIDKMLMKENTFLVFKLHHLQENNALDFAYQSFSNIKFLKESDFSTLDSTLYGFLSLADALITDFSSVYFDFLLMKKPIGLIFVDYDEYSLKPGFSFEDARTLLKGVELYTYADFVGFLKSISKKEISFNEDMECVSKMVNFPSNNSYCETICAFFGI